MLLLSIFTNGLWPLFLLLFILFVWFLYQTYKGATCTSFSIDQAGKKTEYPPMPFYKIMVFWFAVAVLVAAAVIGYVIYLDK